MGPYNNLFGSAVNSSSHSNKTTNPHGPIPSSTSEKPESLDAPVITSDMASTPADHDESKRLARKPSPSKSKQLWQDIESIISHTQSISRQMNDMSDWTCAHLDQKMPFSQWPSYAGIDTLDDAVAALEGERQSLEAKIGVESVTVLPLREGAYLLTRVCTLSTRICNEATLIMTTMNEVMAWNDSDSGRGQSKCDREISSLDEARSDQMARVRAMLDTCTNTTAAVWATVDLLQWVVYPNGVLTSHFAGETQVKSPTPRFGWRKTLPLLSMTLLLLLVAGLTGMMIWGFPYMATLHLNLSQQCTSNPEAVSPLHQSAESRIDNLWDSLGSPDTNGSYTSYWQSSGPTCDIKSEMNAQIVDLKREVLNGISKLGEEMVNAKKANQRMDIRFSKRLDDIARRK